MDKIKLGVVGLGHRGRLMFKLACDSFDFVIPTAACDILPHNWYEKQWLMDEPMCELFPDVKFYESYDEMLEKAGLDVVLVETGADVHAQFCIKALNKNINVMTDIPVVANLQEANDLWEAHKKSSAMISVGANANEQKFVILLKDYFNSGKLGKPYCMECEYIHWSMDEEFNRGLRENGNWRDLLCPIRYCTHSLGPLLTVVEEDLRYVSCFGTGQHADEYPEGDITDDMSCAQFRTESGVIARLMRNGEHCRAHTGHHNYRIFGTNGYMEKIDRFDKPMIRYNSIIDNDEVLNEVSGENMPPQYAENEKAKNGHDGVDYALFDHFFDALRNGKPAPISLREGLRMTLPGIYAEESLKRKGEVIKMVYPWDDDWSVEIK